MIRQGLAANGGAEPFAFLASRMDSTRVPLYRLRREIYEHYLGRLAAVNTLLWIRQEATRRVAADGGPAIRTVRATHGALASEYYSIAKLAGSRRERRALLDRALEAVALAFDGDLADPSGLYAIRGSILQALGRLRVGLHDYRRVLEIRNARGEDAGRVGEAEAELGMGYLRLGRVAIAGRYLASGAAKLEKSERHPFTVRALRKLALFYVVTLRLQKARQTLTRARDIAEEHEIRGQLVSIKVLLRRLEVLDWRRWLRK